MRIAIVGQRDFGSAVLDAFKRRGDGIAGVFCAPERPGEVPDPLRLAAEQIGIPVYALPSLRVEEARRALRNLGVDLAVMAYVVQFVPQDFATIPRHGTIQARRMRVCPLWRRGRSHSADIRPRTANLALFSFYIEFRSSSLKFP